MRTLREWWHRLVGTLRRQRSDADLEEELRAHLELAAEARARVPHATDMARVVRLRAGGVSQAMDALRDQRGLRWLEDFGQDVRFALRGVRRASVVAAVIVLSLGLGIGANTALFSLIEATLLRELPVESPEDLVSLRWNSRRWFPDDERFAGSGSVSVYGRRSSTFSNAAFEALAGERRTLSDVFAFSRVFDGTVTIGAQTDTVTRQLVSGEYFTGLRLRPARGRLLALVDDAPSAEPAAVISDRFWARRFGRDPAALGSHVTLDGAPFTIVGVAPPEFLGAVALVADRPDFWVPLAFSARFGSHQADAGFWWLSVMGRKRPGVEPDQIRNDLEGAFRTAVTTTETMQLADLPEIHALPARRGASIEGPEDEVEHAVVLGAIFGSLLLLVCLNVAGLLLSRSTARRAEIDVRLALGATRPRLARQLLTESLVLAVCGGALGVMMAHWGKALFAASTFLTHDLDLRLQPGVLGATLLLSALAGLGCGLIPALRATGGTSRGIVVRRDRGRGPRSRFSRTLLVTQVAASVVLLVGAGLFIRTLGHWQRIDTGFRPDNVLVFQLDLEDRGLDRGAATQLIDRLVRRIRAVPGVVDVTTSGPFWRDRWFGRPVIDGQEIESGHSRGSVPRYLPVRDNFFEVIGLPLRAGRGFRPDENGRRPDAAVIDEQFARRFFGNVSPLGHRVALARGGPEVEVIGVVGTMWWPGTRPDEVMPRIFLSESMRATDFDPDADQWNIKYGLTEPMSILVRAAGDPMPLVPAVRAATQEITPDLPVLDPKTVAQGFGERLAPTRIVSLIWLSFGAVALVLTAMGLYGLLASSVAQRTQEIGVRAALGAGRFDIVRLITGQTMWLVVVGIVVGLGASMAGAQLVRAYVFGVTFHDSVTLAAVVGIVVLVTLLAALQPTRRALRVDPAVALRWE